MALKAISIPIESMDDTSQRDGRVIERQVASAPLTDRANREPDILRGLTSSEATLAILIVAPIWLLIGVLVAVITEIWALGVLLASLAPMITIWIAAGWLAKVKRNKPDDYYTHSFRYWLAANGFRNPFISHKGYWENGRNMDVSDVNKKAKSKASKRTG